MDIEPLLDELRLLASNGLRYADDPWEEERWERVQELISDYAGEAVDLPSEEVRQRFKEEGGHATTKVGADAAIFDENSEVLLIKRASDKTWGMPGGWVELAESPQEAVVRETREETGLLIEPVELVNVYNRRPGEYGFHGQVNIVYRCKVISGEIQRSHESLAVQYRDPAEVSDWHADHELRVLDALKSF